LGPAIAIIAGWQSLEAIKLLSGNLDAVSRKLLTFDFWHHEIRQIKIEPTRVGTGCPACGLGRRDFLDGSRSTSTQILCGRNAVQIQSPNGPKVDLQLLADRLSGLGSISLNPFLLRFESTTVDGGPFTITVFPDGRGIVAGTEDPAMARRLYATWIGQ
jgi:adenylyltransferase/sulfurtransferase